MFSLCSEVTEGLSAFSKCKVAQPSPKAHCQEQPAIVRHGNQHEEVCHAHLYHMQPGLHEMEWAAILLDDMTQKQHC